MPTYAPASYAAQTAGVTPPLNVGLKEERDRVLLNARSILDTAKAAGRDPSEAEFATVEAAIEKVKELDAKIAANQKSADLVRAVGGLAPNESHGGSSTTFGRMRLGGLKYAMTNRIKAYSQRIDPGTKNIAPNGNLEVPVDVTPAGAPIPNVAGERPPRLTDMLDVALRPPVYSYLRQATIHDPGGAAVVRPGDLKPELDVGGERIEDRLRVVAVVSKGIDRYALADNALEGWIGAQLTDAVWKAIELEVLTGEGSSEEAEHLVGLGNVSGIAVQAPMADRLTTVRYGLGQLEDLGVPARVIALSSQDWLALSTFRHQGGGFDLNPSGPVSQSARTAWGTQVVVVPGLPQGTGFIIGEDAVVLSTDGTLRVEWSTSVGEDFRRNLVRCRSEIRVNLDTLQPHRIVEVQLGDA